MTVVLDSSAVIAMLAGESGDEIVREALAEGIISSVNFAEVVSFFARIGDAREAIRELLAPLDLTIAPFEAEQAETAGLLARDTRNIGLSLGDRACLALARAHVARVLTADRAWSRLAPSLDFDVVVIR